ncbi:MAG TPA: sigma factor [Flavobacteriaceae bacterium]|nr:sigma factor [Flavobacteriaceae bacterium]
MEKKGILKKVFDLHYVTLVIIAYEYLSEASSAKDVVQSVFVNLYRKDKKFKTEEDFTEQLFKQVKNECYKICQTKRNERDFKGNPLRR